MRLLKSDSSFSRAAREQDEGRYASGNMLLWVAAIAVLLGVNFASWSFCMWVFGQPEHPMNYKILTQLEKLDPIRGFTPVKVPRGKFYSAKNLYSKVYPFSKTELKAYNGILKRFYLKNYKERDDVVFLAGNFKVESVRQLTEEDIFTRGLVIRAKAEKFPDAFIDLVLPAEEIPESVIEVGEELKVEESLACAAVINVDRREDDVMIFTAIPLVADPQNPFKMGKERTIVVSPPEFLNLKYNRWPISEDPVVVEREDEKKDEAEKPDEADES